MKVDLFLKGGSLAFIALYLDKFILAYEMQYLPMVSILLAAEYFYFGVFVQRIACLFW